MKLQAKVVVQTQNRLGEGVVWSMLDRQLLWTDIFGRRSHGYYPVAIETEPFALVDRLACSATLGGDHIFASFAAGPGLFHLNGSAANDMVAIERGLPTIRIIDNKPDQRGRFTIGTMDEQPQAPCPTGSFRNFDDTLSLRKIFSSVRISSPIEFSTERRQSYCTRTPSQCFDVCDWHPGLETAGQLTPCTSTTVNELNLMAQWGRFPCLVARL